MRSTLLFVAVLLACTPMRAQSTAPPGAAPSSTWFDAFFPEPATQIDQRKVAPHRAAAPQTFARPADPQLPPQTGTTTGTAEKVQSAALLHSPNAP